MRYSTLLAVWLGMGIDLVAAPDLALAAHAKPPAVESIVTSNRVRIDGSLALKFDLGSLRMPSGEELSFTLQHRLDTDYARRTRTVWEVPELGACVTPRGRDALACRIPGIGELMIPTVPLGAKFVPVGRGYSVRRSALGDFTFRNANGWEWEYRDWMLVIARGPGGVEAEFETRGGRVSAITVRRYRILAGALAASYDDDGSLTELRIGNRRHRFGYEPNSRQLNEWTAESEEGNQLSTFTYQHDLLAGVSLPREGSDRFIWEDLPRAERPDSPWPNRTAIAANAEANYTYSHGVSGYAYVVNDATKRQKVRMVMNNRLGEIRIFEDGQLAKCVFFGTRRGNPEAGLMTRVEDGRGRPLEIYEYNASGAVVRAGIADEPDLRWITFRYDESGRMLSAENALKRGQPAE